MRNSEGRAVGSSSVLVMAGIALSLSLGVSEPTTVREFWRQSLRCECETETLRSGLIASTSCVLLLVSCKVKENGTVGNADLRTEFVTELRLASLALLTASLCLGLRCSTDDRLSTFSARLVEARAVC